MNIEEDLQRIALQEERLQFTTFDARTAWDLGSRLRETAEARQLAIVIDIQLHELPLFYFATRGTTPDNPEWVRRKRNIVRRFFRSSYAIGLMVKAQRMSLENLDPREYAHHGGSFPVLLEGTGCIGTITVSGLPQREDHCLVVETLASYLGKDISDIELSPTAWFDYLKKHCRRGTSRTPRRPCFPPLSIPLSTPSRKFSKSAIRIIHDSIWARTICRNTRKVVNAIEFNTLLM